MNGRGGRYPRRRLVPDDRRRADFETTALPFARPLYATALRITGRADDAKDVVQETFLRAYRTFDNFVLGTNPKAWLFTILRSVSTNRWRHERRQPAMVALGEWEERFGPVAAKGVPTDDTPSEEVDRALESLPEGQAHEVPVRIRAAAVSGLAVRGFKFYSVSALGVVVDRMP